jgi:hypothetical protein
LDLWHFCPRKLIHDLDATSFVLQRLLSWPTSRSHAGAAKNGSHSMFGSTRKLTALAVGISLMSVTTGAIAAAPVSAPAPVASTASVNPWLALGAMNSSSAAAAATAAAAQDYRGEGGMGMPPIPVLVIVLATLGVGIWILTKDDDADVDITVPPPVSPF